jgi:pilus assembly protein CpaE
MMRAGVREMLAPPFDENTVSEALSRMVEAAGRAPRPPELTDQLFAFLPSKPGSGTTSVAVNLSAALARVSGGRVLLADFDLNSGLVGFMLKIDSPYSVTHAAENAYRLDENLWRQLISTAGELDVLPSGKIVPGFRIEAAQVRGLLDFARRHYKIICADLSGNMEKYSLEVMHEARMVFLVCTAELPSLHLAREKLGLLRSLDLADRVQVIVNRSCKSNVVTPAEVERLLGQPVCCVLPNDYKSMHKAVASGQPVEWSSELGKAFLEGAKVLLGKGNGPEVKKKKFVEYFSLTPARFSVFPGTR